jgi:hypothetical protein
MTESRQDEWWIGCCGGWEILFILFLFAFCWFVLGGR